MSPALQAAGLALLGGAPLALLAWAAAVWTERLTGDARLRERAWMLALHLPLLAASAAAAATFLPDRPGRAPEPAAATGFDAAWSWAAAPAPAAGLSPGSVLDALWTVGPWLVAASLAGACLRLLLTGAGARRAARLAEAARPLEDDRVLEPAGREAARLGVPAPEVRVSSEVGAPMLAGLRRPAVLLPEALVRVAGPEALALICAHELAHQRRRDNLRLLADEAVLGALWFNPAAYPIRAGLRAAREEACDALALEAEPPAVRRLYAETLVRSLRLRAGPELQPAFTGARRRTKMRLHALLHPAQPPRRTRRLLAGGLLTALAAGAGGGALALADAAPKPVGPPGLHLTPEPEVLKRYVQADRSSGMREAVDVYSVGVELAGRAPGGHPVTVNGRPAAPEQELAALRPVEAVQVRREATIPFGPKPRILQAGIRLAQADVPQPPAPPQPPVPSAQGRSSVLSYTSVTTADEPGGATNVAVTVRADRMEEQPNGGAVHVGRVSMQASGVPAGLILVNGRPQPAGFDVSTLNGRIKRVETRGQESEGPPTFNVITR